MERERTRYLSRESKDLRMGYPSIFSFWLAREFSLNKDAAPDSEEYPDPRAMSEDEFNDCWLDLNKLEKEWGGYLDATLAEVLTPNQLRFYNAVDDRNFEDEEREEEDYNRECAEFAKKEKISLQKARKRVANRAVKKGMEEYDRKRWESLTFGQKIVDVISDILWFPVELVITALQPGSLQTDYPRVYSVFQATGNWLMMSLLVFLLLFPPCMMVHPVWGMRRLFLLLIVPTMLVMALYAPWYTILSMIPFWIFYAALSAITYGTGHPPTSWTAFWFWLWTIYPFVRGILHILQWEEGTEGKAAEPPGDQPPHGACIDLAGDDGGSPLRCEAREGEGQVSVDRVVGAYLLEVGMRFHHAVVGLWVMPAEHSHILGNCFR